MNETTLIATRLRQTFNKAETYGPTLSEGAFHGPSLLQTLEGADHVEASARPLPGRHTIWELVNHCRYWMKAIDETLRGHPMPDIEHMEDWPETGKTEEEWRRDLDRLNETFNGLLETAEGLHEKQLDSTATSMFHGAEFKISYRKMLHGAYDHNLYHAGQISILRRK
ncbi:DinB family protein [Candidatus Bathyarchaeota archaeon]|nr:DinB family protein [Candidatus Bathyarchaeota archaeon]